MNHSNMHEGKEAPTPPKDPRHMSQDSISWNQEHQTRQDPMAPSAIPCKPSVIGAGYLTLVAFS